uniref:Uncharacterized protein n=1 Tax=Globodera rostochiensis TaxID=31243 RepID=A0A914HV67_GLORO
MSGVSAAEKNGESEERMEKISTSSPRAMSEEDTLVDNGTPIRNYQSMDQEPLNLNNEIPVEGDNVELRENASGKGPKRHRRRRMRYLSQNSMVGGRRPTLSRRTAKKNRRRQLCGPTAPPRHVHYHGELGLTQPIRASEKDLTRYEADVEEVQAREVSTIEGSLPTVATVGQHQQLPTRERDVGRMRHVSGGSSIQCEWIEETFNRRECSHFIRSSKDSNKREGPKRWSIHRHTNLAPTDAYGTIEFQGGPHPFKAQYLRLGFDSDPADIMCLFENVWQLEPPKLIITIHGGMTNFDLQPKLSRVFRKGLLKAARTTGAWIFTSGINAGVVRHMAVALEQAIPTSKIHNKIVSVGIAPWGLLKRREDFVGRDKVVLYHPQNFHPKTRLAVLNNRHSYFLLVDNGTVGRYGADIILRRRLESYIAEKQKLGGGIRSVPVVCVVLEGGTCTIRTVLDYVTTIPKVPVVICDGSGRASDLLAFAHRYIQEDGNLPEGVRPQLLSLIEDVFFYDKHDAHSLIMDILACVRQRNLLTVFRLGEDQKQDVDYAILTALLKGHNLSPAEQLSLALAWNRVDIARSDIFVMGQDWPKTALNNAMMEALIHNRVDFVRLLLENGVSMHDFLTIGRLEELYNTDQGPPNTLYYIVRDVVKIRAGYRYKLPHIGMAIEKLMANGFRSHYTSSQFSRQYSEYRNKLKESQRYSQSPIDLQTVSSRGGAYHRTGSDFFTRGFFRNFPSSASDSRLGESHTTATGIRPTGGQPQASQTQQRLHNSSSTSNYATMNAIPGNRALSNHILWRTAYRREGINNLGARQKSTATMIMPPANRELPNDAIEYATEVDEKQGTTEGQSSTTHEFIYPFSDLLLWAVLTKRHEMALCMWQHGEEALAKALVACRLYKTLANEAAEDYLEVEVCEELKTYAEEFRQLSLELVDHCYKQDDAQTLQLLTYELFYWGHQTCLSLAVIVNNKQFLAHPCCQILLADLWHGGLRIRSNSNLKFKSREELLLQPQTAAEHQKDINESSSSSSESSSSSSSSESESDDDESDAGERGGATVGDRRRTSHGSMQSLNFTSIFQSKRKRHRPSHVSSSTAIKEDIEMGKQKNREPSRNTPMKDGRVAKNPQKRGVEDGAALSRGKGGVGEGVNALVAQSTLGAVVPSATNSTGGSPLLSHAPLPLNNSLNNAWTASADCHMRTDGAIRSDRTAPHFLLGSISENIDGIPPHSKNDYTKSHYLHGFGGVEPNGLSKNPIISRSFDQIGRLTANGGYVPKGIPLPEGVTLNKKRQIKFRRRLYEFFVAPITTFWAWTLSFIVFLSTLTYVLLIKTPPKPSYLEWYLFAYVVAFGLEIARKFFMSEPKKIKEKFEHFFGNYWNFVTSLAVIGFIIGFAFRLHTPTSKSVGRIILAVDSVLWSMKLLDFLGVHSRFGPYITMAGKMIMNMSSIVVMLVISLLGFGLARQSITYPNEEWDWLLLRNVFYKPYFMLYGEVYADEIDTCGDEAWDEHLDKNVSIANAWTHRDDRARELACVPGHWIPPILMTIFLLIANILLISMLIAIFNNIFESANKISQQIWLFQRYRQVMEYEATPFLPPPFTPIYYIYMCFKYINYRDWMCICCSLKLRENTLSRKKELKMAKKRNLGTAGRVSRSVKDGFALFDFSLKLFLSNDQVEKLHDFEEECMEDFAREKEYERNRTSDERLHRTCERTELILLRVNDITSKETTLKGNVRELESRLGLVESRQTESLQQQQQQLFQKLSMADSRTNVCPLINIQSPSKEVPLKTDEMSSQISTRQNEKHLKTDVLNDHQNKTHFLFPETRERRSKSIQNYEAGIELLLDQSGSAKGRLRTSTIAGTDYTSNAGISSDCGAMTSSSQHKFGSLISLGPARGAKPSLISPNLQIKKSTSTRKRYRQNEEYTSITDAIDIEFERSSSKAGSEVELDTKEAGEMHIYQQRERAIDAGMQTEYEEEEEDEEEDEDMMEEEDDIYGEGGSNNSAENGRRRVHHQFDD